MSTPDRLALVDKKRRVRQDEASTGETYVTTPVITTGTARSPVELVVDWSASIPVEQWMYSERDIEKIDESEVLVILRRNPNWFDGDGGPSVSRLASSVASTAKDLGALDVDWYLTDDGWAVVGATVDWLSAVDEDDSRVFQVWMPLPGVANVPRPELWVAAFATDIATARGAQPHLVVGSSLALEVLSRESRSDWRRTICFR